MIISSTEKYLTIGSVSFNKARIKAITKDQDIVIIDASGREDPETAPGNVIPISYPSITGADIDSADDLKELLLVCCDQNITADSDVSVDKIIHIRPELIELNTKFTELYLAFNQFV